MQEGDDVRVKVDGKWAFGKLDEIYGDKASVAWYDIGCMTDDIPLADIYPATCPICGGDCSDANPPVMDCPMKERIAQ